MICDFGDVVVVPFPFVDRPIAKRRPSLVLSSYDFNADSGQSVLAMITTASRSSWPSDLAIVDMKAAGMAHPSVIRWKLFTLPNQLILRAIGKLAVGDRTVVSAMAQRYIAPSE